jgi:hypothetical protein
MSESEPDLGDLIDRISKAVSGAIGDGEFDPEIAVAAAWRETDAIREETGINFILENVDGRYSLIIPLT